MDNSSSAVIILSREKNAYYNLAVEKKLLNGFFNRPVLFLWQSKNAVIIGAHQNPFTECNLVAMQENQVQLARRLSGGGAVYHDDGNLNFCFVNPKKHDKKINFEIVLSALKGLKINAELTGRNDIVVNGFKISGSAYYNGKEYSMHHGTLLINSNLNELSRYLTPSKEKLLKNGVNSVKSRVTNLSQVNENATVQKVEDCLINAFKEKYGNCEIFFTQLLFSQEEINCEITKISSHEYLYSKWNNFTKKAKKRFDWGYCSIDFTIDSSDKIALITIESDAMQGEALSKIEKELLGVNPFNLALENLDKSEYSALFCDVVCLLKESYDK